MRALDIANRRFGRLTVVKFAESTPHGRLYECRCDCGALHRVQGASLAAGRIRSCGCLRRELVAAKNTTHGLTYTAEYRSWSHIIDRCTNPNCPDYKWYGARGITMCRKWRRSFVAFLHDVGPRPSPRHSIDRIDNDGPYTGPCAKYPNGNCRWATPKEQRNNQRRPSELAN
jgi:hypothetical protein